MSLRKNIKIWWLVCGAVGLFLLLIVACNVGVMWNAKGRTFEDISNAPTTLSALVLGTSPITPRGIHNGSFDNRIKAASELYKAGKVKKLIVSGGDYKAIEKYGCDEPKAMRNSLIANGVKPEDIFMDYEGTTTLRSLAKLKSYYGYSDTITIISQGYHNQRALAMADRLGLPAVAFDADVPPSRLYKVKNYARESLARVKMLYSLFLLSPPSALSFSSDDMDEFDNFITQDKIYLSSGTRCQILEKVLEDYPMAKQPEMLELKNLLCHYINKNNESLSYLKGIYEDSTLNLLLTQEQKMIDALINSKLNFLSYHWDKGNGVRDASHEGYFEVIFELMNLVNGSLEALCSTDLTQDEVSFRIDDKAFKKSYKEMRENVCGCNQLPFEIEPQDLNIKNKAREALDKEMMIWQEWMDLRDKISQLLPHQQRSKYQESSNNIRIHQYMQLKNEYMGYGYYGDEVEKNLITSNTIPEKLLNLSCYTESWNRFYKRNYQ